MEFVDSNVLIYAYDTSAEGRHQQAKDLVARLGRTRQGAVSIQVLQEFHVNAVGKIAVRLSPEDARTRLRALSRWTVHSPLPSDVLAASTISEDHRISFWAAMIVRSAGALGCSQLWTEDLNDGQIIAGVRISNPFAAAG